MALEAVGLAFGAMAIVSVFKDCIDILSYVSAYKEQERDWEMLNAKVDLEKALLLQWANRVGLGTDNYDHRLDEEPTRSAVLAALEGIRQLFADTSQLRNRYGLRKAKKHLQPPTALISSSSLQAFDERFSKLKIGIEASQRDVSVSKKIRWAVHDKEKFDSLIRELSHLTDRIDRLIPFTLSGGTDTVSTDVLPLRKLRDSRLILDASSIHSARIQESVAARHTNNCQKRIIDVIWFRSMNERRDHVAAPCPETFEWVVESPTGPVAWTNLIDWLKGEGGLYWICGKAAAGKSTLMKHILQHEKVEQALRIWAGNNDLMTASFFLTNTGADDQNSHVGLSRALLYNIVVANQGLISELLPEMWRQTYDLGEDEPSLPSVVETRRAFEAFADLSSVQKWLFAIDGLDEYRGDYSEGITLLLSLVSKTNIKVLVSSRPLSPCFEAFGAGPMLRLDDLNRKDISTYVATYISANPKMQILIESDPREGESIVNDLLAKSGGVFLWVVIACRSILAGLMEGDYVHELRERVNELPPELEALFKHILDQIQPRHRSQALQLLQIAYRNQKAHDRDDRLFTLGLALMAEHDKDLSRVPPHVVLTNSEKLLKCQQFERRVRSRCCGLLEIVQNNSANPDWGCVCGRKTHNRLVDSTIRFLHRTLFEYLDGPATAQWIVGEDIPVRPEVDAGASVACHSLTVAWLSGHNQRSSIWFRSALRALIDTNLTAQSTIMDCLRTLGAALRETTCLVQKDVLDPDLSAAIILAVETGMTEFLILRKELTDDKVGKIKSHLPLLFHATNRPVLRTALHWKSEHSVAMVHLLLSAGCDPNEVFEDPTSQQPATPWSLWLRACRTSFRMRSQYPALDHPVTVLQITEHFVTAGADLSLVNKHLGTTMHHWARAWEEESPAQFLPASLSLRRRTQQVLDGFLETVLEAERGLKKRRREGSPVATQDDSDISAYSCSSAKSLVAKRRKACTEDDKVTRRQRLEPGSRAAD